MNESATTSPETESLPDYKLAAQELDTLFASLLHDPARPDKPGRLSYHISKPVFATDAEGWDHFAYRVTFIVRAANGREMPSYTFDWRAGVGCVDWKAVKSKAGVLGMGFNDRDALDSLANNFGKLTAHGKEVQARVFRNIAAQTSERTTQLDRERAANPALAKVRRMIRPVNPAEVLARCCAEGVDSSEPFQDWCGNFGYEEDSRKAMATYLLCQEQGQKARAIAGEHYAKMAELSSRL